MTALPRDSCQCQAHPASPCGNAVTQEDLRCDYCRGPGPCVVLFIGPSLTVLQGHAIMDVPLRIIR